MRPTTDSSGRATPAPRPQLRTMRTITASLTATAMLVGGWVVLHDGDGGLQVLAAPPSDLIGDDQASATLPVVESSTTASTMPSTTSTDSAPGVAMPPPYGDPYLVPLTEAEPEVKQLAVDIVYWLTNYEATDDHSMRLQAVEANADLQALTAASAPLTYPGSWSRGEVIYPQLGGLRNSRASVMVVTRQVVGSGPEPEFTVVRTLDLRFVKGSSGWEFDFLSSAGGTFERLEDLALAHAVAGDSRIEMPDSARLDILNGLISPALLRIMAEIADQTPYGIVVLATGHPYHVFETDRQSHHTGGRAVDIYRVGDRLVIDDREPDSATRDLVEWLYRHPDVRQIGSPWDIDGGSSSRSFTDAVHQDHIHVAVNDGP